VFLQFSKNSGSEGGGRLSDRGDSKRNRVLRACVEDFVLH
jgi:hypothetical protein